MYKYMGYYCDVCDKTFIKESKSEHLRSLTHHELETFIPIWQAIEKLDLFDIDSILKEFVTNHNE